MIIDTQVYPALFEVICHDEEAFRLRCDEMNYHLMKPSAPDLLRAQYALAELDHVVLLAQDCSAEFGRPFISNEEIRSIIDNEGDGFYIGFASVDPRVPDAAERLEQAFTDLDLAGLALSPAKLGMFPSDERMKALYRVCERYNKPVMFQAGLSLETNAISKYARPVEFEEVAIKHPHIKMCLSQLGWPWVEETAAFLVKLPNLYANTSVMCMGGPYQLFEKIFRQDYGRWWLDHDLADKIMFGSDSPRIRPVRSKRGLDALEMEPETRRKVYGENALRFLGIEG